MWRERGNIDKCKTEAEEGRRALDDGWGYCAIVMKMNGER